MSDFELNRRSVLGAGAGLALFPWRTVLAAAGPEARAAPSTAVRLSANENPYGPSAAAQRAAREAVARGNRYVPREAQEALVRTIAEREGLSAEHVVLTAGSTELLCTAAAAFGVGGSHVLCSDEVFPVLPRYAERLGARVERVPMTEGKAHDLAALEARVSAQTRLVYVCNPSNPTGTVVPTESLRRFCARVSAHAPVLVDEAYVEYLEEPASMVELLRQGHDLVISRTFSKVYGLAGLRIGYGLARPQVAERLRALRMSLPSPVALAAARASLLDPAFVTLSRTRNAQARAWTARALDALGVRYIPSHANFLYFRAPSRELPAQLLRRGVAITHTAEPLHSDWARVSIGTLPEMRAFAAALGEALRS
ncbi:MAG TPA: histidinol-phosphate transaminase [Aggregicoccus sp.]|nr:histidinol-phosphate transaminase [Aggregicoccus sp.]